jgi:hypothetical protein
MSVHRNTDGLMSFAELQQLALLILSWRVCNKGVDHACVRAGYLASKSYSLR